MNNIYVFLFLLLFFLLFIEPGISAANPEQTSQHPNILLITLDTTRADHLECYGYNMKTMPYVCELAEKKALLYQHAFSNSPLTLPAHTSLLTGLDVHNHLVLDNGLFRLDKNKITLPALLKKNGYSTYAYISAAVLDRVYGLDKGFDVYDDNVRMGKREFFDYKERAASQVMSVVEKDMPSWKQPWFVWIHFYDPHDPYVPPRPFDSAYSNPYDGELAFVDSQIKKLFELLANTKKWQFASDWAFIIGDHGEDLGDFNEVRHGILITPPTIHVPFIVFAPGKSAQKIPEPVCLYDFAPTVLNILNLWNNKNKPAMDGIPIIPSPKRTEPIFITTIMPLFSFRWSPLIAALDYPLILIKGSKDALINWEKDPSMKEKLNKKESKQFAALTTPLNKIKRALIAHMNPDLNNIQNLETIRSLGYVGSAGKNMPQDPFILPDPRDKVHLYKEFLDAGKLIAQNKLQEALTKFTALTKEDPSNTLMLNRLATVYEGLGDIKKSEETLLKVKDLIPDMDYPYFHLGQFYMRQHNPEEAEKYYQLALQRNPRYADVYSDLFQIDIQQQKTDDAFSLLKKARKNDVKDVDLLLYLAIFSKNDNKWQDALSAIDDAISLNPADLRLLVEKTNIICAPASTLNDQCPSFFSSLNSQALQVAETWVAAAEWLQSKGRMKESLFCWLEASRRPVGHPQLPDKIKQTIQKLQSQGISPMQPKWE